MDPFRHCHRNSLKGLCSPWFSWSPLSPFLNLSFLLGNLPHNSRSLLLLRVPSKPHIQISNILPPKPVFQFSLWSQLNSLDQVLDRLVSPSSMHCCTSTDDLSPGSLPGVLLLSNGTLLLEVGFTLRCLQRLSAPHFASLLCRWHDNSCTSDASTPVLSY